MKRAALEKALRVALDVVDELRAARDSAPAPALAAMRATQEERAAMVAWLRSRTSPLKRSALVDAIARGEHRRAAIPHTKKGCLCARCEGKR